MEIDADSSAIIEFQRSVNVLQGQLDHLSLFLFVRDMERRAVDRMQSYLYYMAKAYEYRLLRPYPGSLTLDSTMKKLQALSASSEDQPLQEKDIESVAQVYPRRSSAGCRRRNCRNGEEAARALVGISVRADIRLNLLI